MGAAPILVHGTREREGVCLPDFSVHGNHLGDLVKDADSDSVGLGQGPRFCTALLFHASLYEYRQLGNNGAFG